MSNSLQPHELQHTFWFFSSCSSTGFYVSKSWGTLLLQNIFSRGNCRNRVEKRFGCIFYLGILSRFSHAQLFATLWTVAHQAPLSMGFSRQEYWGGLPFPSLGDPPHPGIKPMSPRVSHIGRWVLYHCATWEACYITSYSPKAFNGPSNKTRAFSMALPISMPFYSELPFFFFFFGLLPTCLTPYIQTTLACWTQTWPHHSCSSSLLGFIPFL